MDKIKIWIVGIVSVLTSALGVLAIPVYLLLGCNVIDYITGLIAAEYRGNKVSSYKSVRGIIKKISMFLLIVIGAWVDILVQYSINTVGIPIMLPFIVSTVVAVWLVVNEMISILENLIDIGVPMPPFLMPIIKRIKKQVEEHAKIEEESGEEE